MLFSWQNRTFFCVRGCTTIFRKQDHLRMNEAPDRTIILGLQHWVTRPDLETIFETKMVSKWSRDHFETRMSHYLEWRDWFRDHIRDQNGLNSGLETSIDTKMSHSGLQIILDHRSLSSIGQKILMILPPHPSPPPLFWSKEFIGGRLDVFGVLSSSFCLLIFLFFCLSS